MSLKQAVSLLHQRCSTNAKKCPDDPLLKKSLSACVELMQGDVPDPDDDEKISDWVKKYVQAVLDETFYEETVLVDAEFPDPHGQQQLQDLLSCLQTPEQCLLDLFQDKIKVKQLLGEEMSECLQWRKGALLYMYCATIMEKPERVQQHKDNIVKCCRDGVGHLQAMLVIRKPIEETRQQVLTNDEDVYKLLQNGIFSDTHMLALVYAGEMCVWCTQLCGDSGCIAEKKSTGTHLLTLYKDLINGPLKDKGWNAGKAIEFLSQLEQV